MKGGVYRMLTKRMIVKEGKGYRYNPDFHY